jgi:hypothetical protein
LSTNNAAKLIKQHCWATTHIGFLVYTAETIIPSYIGAIQGFNTSNDEDVSNVHDLVLQTLRNSEVLTIIDETVSSCPTVSGFAPIIGTDEILHSLEISVIHIRSQGGTLHPIANLYLRWPFDNDNTWSHLTALVAKTEYQDSLLSTGTYYTGWTCTICHGVNHPSGLCPFLLVLGWIKASPIQSITEFQNQGRNSKTPNASQQLRGQGRGNQGHGNNSNFPPGAFVRGHGGSNWA